MNYTKILLILLFICGSTIATGETIDSITYNEEDDGGKNIIKDKNKPDVKEGKRKPDIKKQVIHSRLNNYNNLFPSKKKESAKSYDGKKSKIIPSNKNDSITNDAKFSLESLNKDIKKYNKKMKARIKIGELKKQILNNKIKRNKLNKTIKSKNTRKSTVLQSKKITRDVNKSVRKIAPKKYYKRK